MPDAHRHKTIYYMTPQWKPHIPKHAHGHSITNPVTGLLAMQDVPSAQNTVKIVMRKRNWNWN